MEKNQGLSSFSLHLIAMAAMLCDHLWATLVPGNDWLTWVGRIAFPIFAFLIAEGYRHTRNFKKYLTRMALAALFSEIPFNLMYGGTPMYPFQQNVLWTFCLALLALRCCDKLHCQRRWWIRIPLTLLTILGFFLAGLLLMVDYGGYGVLMVLLFWVFPGKTWLSRLCQLTFLAYINFEMMSGLVVPVELWGWSFDIPRQGAAVLALIPIWLYHGSKGCDAKWTRWLFYGFYPAHMLVLGLLMG